MGATTAVGKAEMAIQAAEVSQAHELAPYSYWLAVSYLKKAKLTEGYSEFEASEDFAVQAADYIEACIEEAQQELDRKRLLEARTKGRTAPAKKKRRKRRRPKKKVKR